MRNWLSYTVDERIVMLQRTEDATGLPDYAVEKDWWITKTLQALFATEIGEYCRFKGGTSLSKGWGLISRFSEDIDIALSQRFFGLSVDNNSQLKKLRKVSRKYLIESLASQLEIRLRDLQLNSFNVEPVTEIDGVEVASDADPTVINVEYASIASHKSQYVKPVVKIEISCLSMEDPSEVKALQSLIGIQFPEYDQDSVATVPTVMPNRTFLEKAFLLCEEFQKGNPRSLRMSRHLYDLERLMDTPFGQEALQDAKLYRDIVEHRRKFYHAGYADYDKDYPDGIAILPPENCKEEYERDYEDFVRNFVQGEALSYAQLIERLNVLEKRFKEVRV